MPRRKNRYTLKQTPIAVHVRILIGVDNKTFYVMRRVGKKWRKIRFKTVRGFMWSTLDYEEALEAIEKELYEVLHSESRKCLSQKKYIYPVNKYSVEQYENLIDLVGEKEFGIHHWDKISARINGTSKKVFRGYIKPSQKKHP